MLRRLVLMAALLVGLTAARPAARELTVFTAASLAAVTDALARAYEQAHPDVRVRVVPAGSQQLVAQLEQGARADVFISADARWMERLAANRALATPARVLATNSLVLIVPPANPAAIRACDDLARPGTRLVLGAPAVPVGAYARTLIERAASSAEARGRILANVVSEEESVAGVLAKVQLGEADAGIVYRSDVTAAVARRVRVVALPDSARVRTSAFIAPLAQAPQSVHARAFVDLALSPAGQRVLAAHGFAAAEPR